MAISLRLRSHNSRTAQPQSSDGRNQNPRTAQPEPSDGATRTARTAQPVAAGSRVRGRGGGRCRGGRGGSRRRPRGRVRSRRRRRRRRGRWRPLLPGVAPSSTSRSSTPSRASRSARKPTASSLEKSVWRTHRSGFDAAHAPHLALADHGEVGTGHRRRVQHDPGRLRRRAGGAYLGDHPGHRERQLAQPLPRARRTPAAPATPRASSSGRTISASSRASGTSTLFRATSRGRSSSPP